MSGKGSTVRQSAEGLSGIWSGTPEIIFAITVSVYRETSVLFIKVVPQGGR